MRIMKQSHSAKKRIRGDPLGFYTSLLENQNNRRKELFATSKNSDKSLTLPEKPVSLSFLSCLVT